MNRTPEELLLDQTALEHELSTALKETREHPGLSIERVAGLIKDSWDEAEVEALVKHLSHP